MSDPQVLNTDSDLPHAQERPDDFCASLCEQIRSLSDGQGAMRARGGYSKSFLLADEAPALELAPYSGVIDYAPSELVISARAGTSIRELVEITEASGQMLPFEPAQLDGKATIGGVVACGLGGPSSHFIASVRDAVLGVACINGQGEFLRFGGRVIKNVAGFDLARLLVGSMGTLAIITEVAIKLVPKPRAEQTLLREVPLDQAISTMRSIVTKAYPVTASAWCDGVWRVRMGGARAALEKARQDIGADIDPQAQAFWTGLRELSHPHFKSQDKLWRISTQPSATLPETDGKWLLDAGGAVRWLRQEQGNPILPTLDPESAHAQGLFGAAGTYMMDASTVGVRENIKRSFDPRGVFPRLSTWLAC